MKLYFECNMGASGNMVMAALYELLPDKATFREKMEQLGLSDVVINYSEATKCGISGTHITVEIAGVEDTSDDVHNHHHHAGQHDHDHNHTHEHDHDHKHSHHDHHHDYDRDHDHHHDHKHAGDKKHKGRRYSYKEILDLIKGLDLPDKVKQDASNVYKIIGEAEAKVHGTSLDEIHFHEVGSIDAIVDVVGCSLLMDMLGVKYTAASPIHVGYGMIRCEHGILPVPAPATAEILRGIPVYSGQIEGELCTPTGAALLKHFAKSFGAMPIMEISKIGYGMGTKDFEASNCLRVYLYEDAYNTGSRDSVYEVSCNLDDMTPEAIGAAFEILLENSALDVYTTPILMKKNRPAVMLSCLCTEETKDRIAELLIKHTTTLGVRMTKYERSIMERSTQTVQTEYGAIRVKQAQGFGIIKLKPEYDDVQAAAKAHKVPFQKVYDAAKRGN